MRESSGVRQLAPRIELMRPSLVIPPFLSRGEAALAASLREARVLVPAAPLEGPELGLSLSFEASDWQGLVERPPRDFEKLQSLLARAGATGHYQFFEDTAEAESLRALEIHTGAPFGQGIVYDGPPDDTTTMVFKAKPTKKKKKVVSRTLVLTHVECKNHITPAATGAEYTAKAATIFHPTAEDESEDKPLGTTKKKRLRFSMEEEIVAPISASPEQPERVTAVFEALKNCRWECGGTRVVEAVELETSPTLRHALDANVSEWAEPAWKKRSNIKLGPPLRTTSVSYLFDDLEPIVLAVHDRGYLNRVATEIEALVDEEQLLTKSKKSTSIDSDGTGATTETDLLRLEEEEEEEEEEKILLSQRKKKKLFRCVSLTATGDTFASAGSLHAALCASYAVCRAVDSVVRGDFRNAFCCVRPPGHHAGVSGSTRDETGHLVGQGFCLINHVAVGARYALANHKNIKKVAVVDWDLHHGNGTAEILCADDGPMARDTLRDSVLFCSIHGATHPNDKGPHLFPGTARRASSFGKKRFSDDNSDDGFPDETPPNAVNVPLAFGAGHAEFVDKFAKEVVPAIEAFRPDLIIISAGFDGHKDDLFKFLKLTDKTFKVLTEVLMDLASDLCQGRIVSVLEGGYSIPTLVKCCTQHVRTLATYQQPLPVINAKTRNNISAFDINDDKVDDDAKKAPGTIKKASRR